jgi:hypothetical protein
LLLFLVAFGCFMWQCGRVGNDASDYPTETPMKTTPASTSEFITLLYGYMLPKYPGLAELLNGNPEPWIIAIARVREICNARGINDDFEQLPYVVANVFPTQ